MAKPKATTKAKRGKKATPEAWLNQIWPTVAGSAQLARRKVTSVETNASEAALIAGAKKRGYHVAIVGPQYVIFQYAIDIKC